MRQAYREHVFNEVKAALAEKMGNAQLIRLRYRKPSILKRILKYGQRMITQALRRKNNEKTD